MAKNTGDMKRTVYKYLRDGVKSNYQKKDACEVCGTCSDLELHHPTTFSLLFDNWCRERNISVSTVDEVMSIREDFYRDHWNELVVDVMTLCNTHHKALHKIYGGQPPLHTSEKQKAWVQRLRDKNAGKDSQPLKNSSSFARFIPNKIPRFTEI